MSHGGGQNLYGELALMWLGLTDDSEVETELRLASRVFSSDGVDGRVLQCQLVDGDVGGAFRLLGADHNVGGGLGEGETTDNRDTEIIKTA